MLEKMVTIKIRVQCADNFPKPTKKKTLSENFAVIKQRKRNITTEYSLEFSSNLAKFHPLEK
jgi:hypothetical protein